MLKALFAAAAEAVFSYILDTLEPAERLRDWLKRNPVRLAYQHALARTYTAFARQYPELTASLFNESFLTIEAVPELAKFLTRHQHPDHTQLVRLWAKSITPQTEAGQQSVDALSKCEDLNAASAYFVELLTSELKHESTLQPLFDSRALESLPAIEAQLTALTATLENNFKQALAIASNYQRTVVNHYQQTVVNRSGGIDLQASNIHIGGDVVGRDKIVSNTYNTYFTGGFETLDDLYVRPDRVFQRVRVQDFVGREWLTAKVDHFLNDENRKSGVFLLVGEAGVGKTSFMAHLVTERRYLHLFAELVPGDVNVSRALQSLGAQLVARYQIDPYKDKGTLPAIAAFPDFLDKLLRLAADRLSAGEKIVIVCDALDEAGTTPNGNVFGLPSVLPDGVYFILSQRPVTVKLSVKSDLLKETLNAAGADNLHDVEQYLTAVSRRPEVSHQLRAKGYTESDFVRILKERSGGVWMYLFYVVSEIAAGLRAPLDLAALPSGLAGYYTDYWGDWCEGRNGRGDGPAKWDTVYAPLLVTLAAAQLPIDLKLLLAWSQAQAQEPEVKRLLRSKWSAFISERAINGTPHFSLYHASLRDFLTDQVDRQGLTPEADQLTQELADCTRDAHRRIVDAYRRQCGGDWIKLADDDYARMYLCLHLSASGAGETMYQLVAMSNAWAEAKYAKEESYTGYLVDLNRAWQYVETDANWNVGRQIRCALIESSIHSLASNVSAFLLRQLVEAHLWSPVRALAHTSQIPDEGKRADSLHHIIPLLPDALKAEALTAARAIQDEESRAQVLSAFAPTLPDSLKAEALAAARAIQDEESRAQALSALTSTLPNPLKAEVLIEALTAARPIQDEWARARVLSALVPMVPEPLKTDVLTEALAAARAIKNEGFRAKALSALAPTLSDSLKAEALATARAIQDEKYRAEVLSALAPTVPEPLKTDVLTEALTAARAIKNEELRAEALSTLVPTVLEPLKTDVLTEALAAARAIQNEWAQARVLSAFAPYLPDPLKVEILTEALAAARVIRDERHRAQVLSALAPTLPEPLKTDVLTEALAAARAIQDEKYQAQAFSDLELPVTRAPQGEGVRVQVLTALAYTLPNPLKTEALTEALATARTLQDEGVQAQVLFALMPTLPDPLKAEALAAARAIKNEEFRALALTAFAYTLPNPLKTEALTEVLAATRALQNERDRVEVLFALAPTLPDSLKAEVLTEALAAARAIQDKWHRALVLSALAPTLPDPLKAEALAAACAIEDEGDRAQALSVLAPALPDSLKAEVLTEALAAVRAIQDKPYQAAQVLSDLAPTLPDSLKAEALAAARAIQVEWARAEALSALAPMLPDSLKAEALAAARAIENEKDRAQALSTLTSTLPDSLRAEVLTETLAAACAIENEKDRAQVLSVLAPTLPDHLKAEALAAARALQDEWHRAQALSAITSTLPDPLKAEVLTETLAAARALQDKWHRAQVLSTLAPLLPQALQIETFNQIFASIDTASTFYIRSEQYRQIVSAWGKERFQGFQRPLWPETLHALAQQARGKLLEALAALVPLIKHLGGQAAIEDFFYALRDVTQWWP